MPAADPYVRAFGAALRRARLRRNWTQGDLGRRYGTTAPQVSRIEHGAQKDVGLILFVRLALALDLTPSILMRAVEDEVLRARG